jgi:hypothetical protein
VNYKSTSPTTTVTPSQEQSTFVEEMVVTLLSGKMATRLGLLHMANAVKFPRLFSGSGKQENYSIYNHTSTDPSRRRNNTLTSAQRHLFRNQ